MRVVFAVALAGCGYHPEAATGSPGDAIDGPGDSIDAPDQPFVLCDQPGTDLRLCFDFDNNTIDRSGRNNVVQTGGVVFVPGVHGQAVDSSSGDIVVSDNASLDVSQLTIRMKVSPSSLPQAGERYGLIENNAYRMFILAGGVVRCAINGALPHEAITVATLPTNTFTRLACTFDGSLLQVYFDGALEASSVAGDTLVSVTTTTPVAQSEPLDPAERLQGAMDELELFGSIQPP